MPTPLKEAFSISENLKSIFVRPTDNLAVLDGLRAISIIWVVIFHIFILTSLSFSAETTQNLLHATPSYLMWIWNGDKGVDIFFVMSGFLISGLLFKEYQQTNKLNLKRFYFRRFLRLTPVYWFTLLIYVLNNGPNSQNAWTNALYINNFIPAKEIPMTWTWSLAVEEQFYLLFPLFLLTIFFRSQQKTRWLLALLLTSCVINIALYIEEPVLFDADLKEIFNLERNERFDRYFDVIYVNLFSRFGPFICGIAASYYFFYHKTKLESWFAGYRGFPIAMMGVTLTMLLVMAPTYQQQVDYSKTFQILYIASNRSLFAIGVTLILISALMSAEPIGKCISRILSMRVWVPIARLSYSIYIFHVFIVGSIHLTLKSNMKARALQTEWVDFDWLLFTIPVCLLLSSAVAILLFVFIEKPFMNLRGDSRPSKSKSAETPDPLLPVTAERGNESESSVLQIAKTS